jgi:hypothetical protein
MGITREQYEAAIPKCCAYQTMEAHESIMLCWGLALAVEEGRNMNCDNCTENTAQVGSGETATKRLRDMTDADFDAAHELPNAELSDSRPL